MAGTRSVNKLGARLVLGLLTRTALKLWNPFIGRELYSGPPGSGGAVPAFVPHLRAPSRALQRSDAGTDAPARLAESERALRAAVEVSGEEASALIPLAHFLDVARDSPTEAEALFAEAARRASKRFEEVWAGWMGVLGEQEKLEAALELASRAQRMFPDS